MFGRWPRNDVLTGLDCRTELLAGAPCADRVTNPVLLPERDLAALGAAAAKLGEDVAMELGCVGFEVEFWNDWKLSYCKAAPELKVYMARVERLENI